MPRPPGVLRHLFTDINKPLLDEILVEHWVKDIRRAIYEEADKQNWLARDFACTLVGAVIGPSIAIFFQIGDGSIVVSSACVQGVVFWPDSGLYANMTYFVTEEDALDHLQVCVTATRIDEIAMFSDGFSDLHYRLNSVQCTPRSLTRCSRCSDRLACLTVGNWINSSRDF